MRAEFVQNFTKRILVHFKIQLVRGGHAAVCGRPHGIVLPKGVPQEALAGRVPGDHVPVPMFSAYDT